MGAGAGASRSGSRGQGRSEPPPRIATSGGFESRPDRRPFFALAVRFGRN